MRNASLLKMAAVLAVAMLLAGCASSMPSLKVNYRGGEVREQGLDIRPLPVKVYLMVYNSHYHYALLLPYSESWQIESDSSRPLHASDDNYIVTVLIGYALVKSPREYYEALLTNMRNSRMVELRDVEFLEGPVNRREILRYKVKIAPDIPKPADVDKFALNYWVAVPHKGKWYAVHLSDRKQAQPDWSTMSVFIKFALDFFMPDYDEIPVKK